MDYRNIVTFIINNNQYYLHYDLVKELPIFEELKKSDKVETIEYPGEITHDEVTIVFDVLHDKTITKCIDIESIARIYNFMMYLTIDYDKIKKCIYRSSIEADYCKNLETIFEKKYDRQLCKMLKSDKQNMEELVNWIKECNDDNKNFLIDCFVNNIENVYGKMLIMKGKYTVSSNGISDFVKNIQTNIGAPIKIVPNFSVNNLKSLYINDIEIELVNVKSIGGEISSHTLADTMKNFAKKVLLGQIIL